MIRFLLLFCVFCAVVLAASWHELESEPAPPRPCVVCVENAAARAAPPEPRDGVERLAQAAELMSRSESMRDAKKWFALDLLVLGVAVPCLLGYLRGLREREDL
ncbi:hypothetical protein [Chromobacterium violaceum]|uniref:Lipoprotein n=1 Tax=Chromobacterium violaceum TaxID=536 RepID=A0AAX2M6A8_CHRVL|nr:hypothetical protein [Chromobacterium violaceum]OLZ83407.1 hypothetical protein BS642_05725 [Chromobacterium violaceum]STB64168.1 Uncharacterised protein [Chromobacterium violaceum]SUX32058.1 Uncharacterised protein [Chromobacterium violaceum]